MYVYTYIRTMVQPALGPSRRLALLPEIAQLNSPRRKRVGSGPRLVSLAKHYFSGAQARKACERLTKDQSAVDLRYIIITYCVDRESP